MAFFLPLAMIIIGMYGHYFFILLCYCLFLGVQQQARKPGQVLGLLEYF